MIDEQIIELVKRYPVLYNVNLPHYRDHTIRNKAWDDIAAQLNTPVDEVRSKWGKLRNCYTNALKRRRKKGQAATPIVPWKFEREMEFLLPHVEERPPPTNSLPNKSESVKDENSTQYLEIQFSDESSTSPVRIRTPSPNLTRIFTSSSSAVRNSIPSLTSQRLNRCDSDSNAIKDMVDAMTSSHELRQKRAFTDMDETDFFFLSMSKQLKKLPKIDQAEIKFQLHKLIHDSEMKIFNN